MVTNSGELGGRERRADKWDWQIELNRAPVLGVFRNTTAEEIVDRMEACPNNPRNGGDGFDTGDGTWVDRRPGR